MFPGRGISIILTAATSLSAIFLFSGFALDMTRTDMMGISASGLVKIGLYILFAAPLLRLLASLAIYARQKDLIRLFLSLYTAAVILVSYFL